MEPQPPLKSSLTIPAAIVFAGAIVGLAVILTRTAPNPVQNAKQSAAAAIAQNTVTVPPVTANDHIFGNVNAPVMIVEYSDPSCPYCKMFHSVMRKVMDDLGKSGNVAWVYRSFPLDKPDDYGRVLHPNAGHESLAFECAGAQGGNEKYFAFANKFYELTPSVTPSSPQGFDQTQLPTIAKSVGLDVKVFNDCLASGKLKAKIETVYQAGVDAGVAGTPYSFIVTRSGKTISLNDGAWSVSKMEGAISQILLEEGVNTTASTTAI
ncbi:MAG: DsbA family protein [bacterium]